MNEPWEQDVGFDDEDYAEGIDDEADELGVDFHTEDAPSMEPQQTPGRRPGLMAPMHRGRPGQQPRPQSRQASRPPGKQKFRIRAMSPAMAARSRDVVSILITKQDGSQVLLVKKG